MKRGGRFLWVVVLALILVGAAACGTNTSNSTAQESFQKNAAGYVDITVDQLAAMLENKNFVLVNVHVPYEGHIPGTDLFIPFDQIDQYLDQLPDKNARIVLYCRSGRMSTVAAERLVSLGYTNVFEVDGGFNAWKASGRPLEFNPPGS